MVPTQDDADGGAAKDGGRRPTVVAAPPSASSELSARPRRRTFTARDKLRILAATDQAAGTGDIGAVLRRHGLYSSHLTKWRQERKSGILEGLAAQKRGPKSKTNPLTAENQKLRRDNERLADRLRKAEIVIDVQKKVAMLLGIPIAETEAL